MDFHTPEVILKMLAVCRETTNLASRNLTVAVGPRASAYPPCVAPATSFDCPGLTFFGIEFTRPLFARITHLAILDWREEGWWTWSKLAQMSRPTQFSFSYYTLYYTRRNIFQNCKSLEVLLVLCSTERLLPGFIEKRKDLNFDPQFVIVLILDGRFVGLGDRSTWSVREGQLSEELHSCRCLAVIQNAEEDIVVSKMFRVWEGVGGSPDTIKGHPEGIEGRLESVLGSGRVWEGLAPGHQTRLKGILQKLKDVLNVLKDGLVP
ncbi:hypothetical protein B0H16DRAFT_1467400 [Mycena metata]|uniref:Uncharacterized protein n=1 Tax=Mycena metata TaxID=1033252 RepID=A0AAD7I5S8_9AGAR|nr:hypothetical protein B0H16DRAFT_1467400 [Mycena metata]